jgi:hypothetical protein
LVEARCWYTAADRDYELVGTGGYTAARYVLLQFWSVSRVMTGC